MLIPERQSRLKELLARRGMSDLDTLSSELSVSQSTVRRDLELLEQSGLVQRTHGGVIWIGDRANGSGGGPGGRPYAFDARMNFQVEPKRQIARAARALVRPGDTILLDGGTTTFYLAQELLDQPLQLVTNSLPIANLFLNDEHVEVVLIGGMLYPRYGVLLGPMAEQALAPIHTKTLFFSVAGIHDGALYNQNLLLVQAERRMMEQSQQIVLLADSGKFGQQALAKLCELSDVDVVVTDSGITPAQGRQVKDAGCELVVTS